MRKLLLWTALVASAAAQNFTTVTASNIGDGSNGTLTSGKIIFQAVGTNQQPISYQVGGGGQQILAPTVCSVTNGAIVGLCSVANTLLTQPQNICFNVMAKNSSGVVVLGGRNSGYQCVQPVTNSSWCAAGVCDFDSYVPNLPSTVLAINMPLPSALLPGGIFSGDCSPGLAVIGYGSLGHPDCGPGGTGGSAVWGGILGTLSNQADLWSTLQALAPLASPVLTGVPATPEPALGDSSSQIANTLWVRGQGFAPLNSPAFTGTPTAPTPANADSSTSIATTAWVNAQGYSAGSGNVTGPGSSTVGHIALFNATNGQAISDSGVGLPLPAASLGTLSAGSNGLAASATTDATNAGNITAGTLAAARLPLPTSSTLGGAKSYSAVSHQWLNSLSTSGAFASSQPACGDLSNAVASCSTDATNASNITSGTLAAARVATLNQSTTGTAANLSGAPALPNGTTAATQPNGDNSAKLATDAFVLSNAGDAAVLDVFQGGPGGASSFVEDSQNSPTANQVVLHNFLTFSHILVNISQLDTYNGTGGSVDLYDLGIAQCPANGSGVPDCSYASQAATPVCTISGAPVALTVTVAGGTVVTATSGAFNLNWSSLTGNPSGATTPNTINPTQIQIGSVVYNFSSITSSSAATLTGPASNGPGQSAFVYQGVPPPGSIGVWKNSCSQGTVTLSPGVYLLFGGGNIGQGTSNNILKCTGNVGPLAPLTSVYAGTLRNGSVNVGDLATGSTYGGKQPGNFCTFTLSLN